MKRLSTIIVLAIFIPLFVFFTAKNTKAQQTVGLWQRLEITRTANCGGNPHFVEFGATFTHSSGTQLTLPGYYDGNNTYKIGFMPTKTGTWSYTISSSECSALNSNGTVSVSSSNSKGILKADPNNPRKWMFANGTYVVPIALRVEMFSQCDYPEEDNTDFNNAVNFAAQNNITLFETKLTDEYGKWQNCPSGEGRYDYIFSDETRTTFDLSIWQNFQTRLNTMSANGVGAHIMLYSDDGGRPKWCGRYSDPSNFNGYSCTDDNGYTEDKVIRYLVARTAGYPIMFYNTGIDIAEYRTQADIDYIGQKLDEYDPYDHPRSSRYGGGSGNYVMSNQTYNSNGYNRAVTNQMYNQYNNTYNIPTSMDDSWGENRPSHPDKFHTEHDIRRAFWKAAIVGGVGGMIRNGDTTIPYQEPQNAYFLFEPVHYYGPETGPSFATQLESEQWLSLVNPFINQELGSTFGSMTKNTSVISGTGVHAITDPGKSKIMVLNIGTTDSHDAGSNTFTLSLTGVNGSYSATRLDTCSGVMQFAGTYAGGQNHVINTPGNRACEPGESHGDWVYLFTSSTNPTPTPTPTPTNTPNPTPTTTPTPSPTPTNTSTPSPTPTPSPVMGDGVISSIDYVASGSSYYLDTLNNGISLYTDRAYTVSDAGIYAGSSYIRTANGDKTKSGNPFLSFTLSDPATVYLAYRNSSPPSWASDWSYTGNLLGTTDVNLHIFSKDFPAGQISIGDNDGQQSMYVVFAKSMVSTIPGDANGDGLVNIQDYVILSNTFGSTTELRADFNGDGVVNIQDYIILSNNFGT